jgi:hypothetical protein
MLKDKDVAGVAQPLKEQATWPPGYVARSRGRARMVKQALTSIG